MPSCLGASSACQSKIFSRVCVRLQFKLEVEEVDDAVVELSKYRQSVCMPLVIQIWLEPTSGADGGEAPAPQLLEQWELAFDGVTPSAQPRGLGYDDAPPQIYKRMARAPRAPCTLLAGQTSLDTKILVLRLFACCDCSVFAPWMQTMMFISASHTSVPRRAVRNGADAVQLRAHAACVRAVPRA
jgi:hypothetical protein